MIENILNIMSNIYKIFPFIIIPIIICLKFLLNLKKDTIILIFVTACSLDFMTPCYVLYLFNSHCIGAYLNLQTPYIGSILFIIIPIIILALTITLAIKLKTNEKLFKFIYILPLSYAVFAFIISMIAI